jgi:uncharacterized membrane protein
MLISLVYGMTSLGYFVLGCTHGFDGFGLSTLMLKKKKKLKITSILCEDIQNCVHYGQVILKIHFFTYFYQDKKAIFFSKFFLFAFNKNTCFTIKI